MDEKQLMKDFCLVSGLDEQQAEGWKPLVLGCWEELCRRLRPAVQPQEHRERLSLACAALAHYRLQRVQGEVYSGIKVRDISLTAAGGDRAGDGGRSAGQRRCLCAGGGRMQPEQMIASAIERCGCSLEFLQAEGSVVLKAYLNPLRERAARTEGGASGMVRQGRWLLLAPCEEQLVREGAQFVRRCVGKAEEKFILERVEKVCWNGKPVYLWGLVVPVQEGRE